MIHISNSLLTCAQYQIFQYWLWLKRFMGTTYMVKHPGNNLIYQSAGSSKNLIRKSKVDNSIVDLELVIQSIMLKKTKRFYLRRMWQRMKFTWQLGSGKNTIFILKNKLLIHMLLKVQLRITYKISKMTTTLI